MIKYKKQYRIPSSRAPWWNYANKGTYFITICTAERKCLLGEIQNNEMVLSDIGSIVFQEWTKSFEIRKELQCDTFVIMPNHIHAIVSIRRDDVNTMPPAPIHGQPSLQKDESVNKIKGVAYRPPKSISSFVAGFKSSATIKTVEHRKKNGAYLWQPRFHDHIIREDDEYMQIKQYIETNIDRWEDDTLFALSAKMY